MAKVVTPMLILKKAASFLTPGHWTKGSIDNGHGAHCELGAVRKAADFYGKPFFGVAGKGVVGTALRALVKTLPKGYDSIIGFNDATKTKRADVLKHFRRAIPVAAKLAS